MDADGVYGNVFLSAFIVSILFICGLFDTLPDARIQ